MSAADGAPLAAVTGATGFLGQRLVPALAAAGWRVRVLARRPTEGLWGEVRPQLAPGDLADAAALAALCDGAQAIIHSAGLIKARDRQAFFAVNAEGAARLAGAAGGARFIHISSLAAREPQLSDYAASKRAGETAVAAALGDRAVILRPPVIYGPGDRETLGLFQAGGASPVMPHPPSRQARLALAHVDDVVGDILGQLGAAAAPGVFAIGGARPEGYGWREIFATAAQAMGRAPVLTPLPPWLIRAAAAVSEDIGRLRGAPAIFNRGKARELLHDDWSVRPAETLADSAVVYRDLATGFADTVAWYRQAGWLH